MGPEQYSTTPRFQLESDRVWLVTGLCYVYAKFPASILQVVKPRGEAIVDVTTLRVDQKLYAPGSVRFPLDNWQHTLQGVRAGIAIRFLADLAAARFRFSDGKVWRVAPQEVMLNDPYSPIRLVKVLYLLPVAEDHRLIITKIINGRMAIIEKKHNA